MISAEVRTLSAKVSGRDIAFVFGGAIGDMIVLSDILDDFIEAQREVNRRFLLVCKPNEAAFLREIKPDIASYVAPFDLNAYLKSSRYRKKRRELIKELSHFALISPQQSKYAEGVMLLARSPIRLEIREEQQASKASFGHWLNKAAYNQHLLVEDDLMAYERYKLLFKLFDIDYTSRIQQFASFGGSQSLPSEIACLEEYCLIAPTSSEIEKSWEFEKFIEIIEWLIGKTTLDIVLCGGPEGIPLIDQIPSRYRESGRLIDLFAKTNHREWIEVVRGAKFVFGNDSATGHIAAHVGTPSILITPGFSYGYVQPYVLDEVAEDDEIPLCLYAFKDCFGCNHKDYKRGAGNSECRNRIRQGQTYSCIHDINVTRARSALNDLLERLGIL